MEGDVKVGGTLTATPTPSDATVTYKWYRSNAKDGTYVVIDGATSNTYTLTDDDFGKYIKVEVKGTGSYTGTKEKVVGPVAASEAAITEALEAVNNYLLAYNYSDHYSEAPGKLEPHLATLGLDVSENSDYDKLQVVGGTNRKTAVFYDLSHENNIGEGYDLESLEETFNSIVMVRTATQASTDAVNAAVLAEELNDLGYIETLQTAFEAAKHTTHSDKTFEQKKQELTDLLGRYSELDDTEKAAVRARIIDKEFLPALKNDDGAFKRSQYSIDALAAALTEVEEASEAAITEALEAVNNYLLAYNYSDHYSEAPGKLEPHLATLGLNGTRGQVVCPTVV